MRSVRIDVTTASCAAVAVCLLWCGWVPAYGQSASRSFGGMGGRGSRPSAVKDFRTRVIEEGGPQYGPSGEKKLVLGVRIVGNETVREDTILSLLRTRRDRQFDPEVVQADVRKLASQGLFRDVRTYTEEIPGGVVVTFEVFERPSIGYVKFLGNRGISDKALLRESGLKQGDAVNRYAVEEARRKIEEYYRSKGFSDSQVRIAEGDKPQDRGVVFDISEGSLERILKVEFVGNTIATDARLKTQIQSKPGILWHLFRGKVDRKKIDEDVERLTAYYRSLGYFRARIGRELEYTPSGRWLKIRYVIDEGPRYKIRGVTVAGNEKFASQALLERLELTSGDFFNLGKMNRDVNTLRDLYGSQGHIFADIQADPRFLEEPGMLDLVYNIEEGGLFRVGKINIHIAGEHPHTRRNVVLNRISLRPGDIIDIREVRWSERRLKASQLFENNPMEGVAPKIVIRPPEVKDADILARRKGPSYRGQSPDTATEGTAAAWVVVEAVESAHPVASYYRR